MVPGEGETIEAYFSHQPRGKKTERIEMHIIEPSTRFLFSQNH